MASSTLSMALLLALVPIIMVAADEKDELYSALFAENAQVMGTEQVSTSLVRILPLLTPQTKDLNAVNSVEVEKLIKAGQLSNDRCYDYNKFAEFYKKLADRHNYKLDEAGVYVGYFSSNNVPGWNENIRNYVAVNQRKQFEACAAELKRSMASVTEAEKATLDQISGPGRWGNVEKEAFARMMNFFTTAMKAKSVSKRHIERELEKMFGKVKEACRSVEKAGQQYKDLMTKAQISAEHRILFDDQTNYWTNRMVLCKYVLHPVTYTFRGGLRNGIPHGQPILPSLVYRISATY